MMYEYENKIKQNLFFEGGRKFRCGNFKVRDFLGSGGVVAWSASYYTKMALRGVTLMQTR